jgi:hypothetical protein
MYNFTAYHTIVFIQGVTDLDFRYTGDLVFTYNCLSVCKLNVLNVLI